MAAAKGTGVGVGDVGQKLRTLGDLLEDLLGFNSQNSYGSSQPSVTPVSENPVSSPGLAEPIKHIAHRQMQAKHIHTGDKNKG